LSPDPFGDGEGTLMKKRVLFLAYILACSVPLAALAAPAGHDICSGSLQGQKIRLVFGTGALCCDATVKIVKPGKNTRTTTYTLSADIDAPGIYSAKSHDGSIRYIVGHGNNIEVVLLSLDVGGVQIDNGLLTCRTLDHTPDPMAN
jgi:hypothetical protein